MKNCAFLTTENLEGFYTYDRLLHEPLKNRGWEVSEVPWRGKIIDWNKYEVVVIRSPWDYQDDPDAFLEVLKDIDRSEARLENPLDLVKWNIDKRYLKEIDDWGIPIVPTLWDKVITESKISSYFRHFNISEIIIKPVIGANADDTFRVNKKAEKKLCNKILKTFQERAFMVQPFLDNIVTEGEYSLFYFADKYSHTILKTPKKGDFRVQEEHGGILKSAEPSRLMIEYSKKLLSRIEPLPLYSRIDFVRMDDGFKLMELELIEPSLYFNMDPDSPVRFADIFDEHMKQHLSYS